VLKSLELNEKITEQGVILNIGGHFAQLWGSMVKQILKRRNPGFNESFYGFASFNELLEEAQSRGYLKFQMDEKSGGYIIQSVTP